MRMCPRGRWYYKYLQLEIPAHVKSPYAATIETFDKVCYYPRTGI